MTEKKRAFGGKTLLFLMVFYLLLGSVILPYWQQITYDDKTPPPPDFPVVVGGGHMAPLVQSYARVNADSHYSLMTEDANFEEYPINFSLKTSSDGIYQLQAKTGIHTYYYHYKIDENHQAVPISIKLRGRIIWIWSLICLFAVTVLLIVTKLIYLSWQKYQNRYDDE